MFVVEVKELKSKLRVLLRGFTVAVVTFLYQEIRIIPVHQDGTFRLMPLL